MAGVTSMRGDGFYDRNSLVQEQLILSGADLLEQAGACVPLPEPWTKDDAAPRLTFGLADFGCSEGKNSVLAMRRVLAAARERRPGLPALVVHNDLPGNNFNALFAHLRDAYAPPTWALASSGSFFESVLPPGSLHVGCCFSAVHWLSAVPPVPDPRGVLFTRMSEPSRKILAAQAASDWRRFLSARALELVPGGRLVLVMGGRNGQDVAGGQMYALLDELLQADPELSQRPFVMPIYYRSEEEVLAPLEDLGFRAESFQLRSVGTPFWDQLAVDGDRAAYARGTVGFLRAWLDPVLIGGIGASSDSLERLFGEMERRMAADPTTHPVANVQITTSLIRL